MINLDQVSELARLRRRAFFSSNRRQISAVKCINFSGSCSVAACSHSSIHFSWFFILCWIQAACPAVGCESRFTLYEFSSCPIYRGAKQGRSVALPRNIRRASATIPLRGGKITLTNLTGIVKQLSKERDRLHQQLSGLNAALEAFAGVYRGNNGFNPRRKMSANGRARIAAAQRARWAKHKGQKVVPITKPKRTMSASVRRKIAAAQRARWAKVRREKKAA